MSSLETTAAPCRAKAASASLLPAPMPPVTATASGRVTIPLAVRALQREREASPLGVDLDHLHLHRVALRDDLARVLHVVLRELRDVHEALDAGKDLDEGAEGHDLRHLAVDHVALVVLVQYLLPRV